ncbi:MAG: Smr/MutS family protein [Christensenellaceae bacterium]|nr:Smr/MutS family protein [Christensenellaceae bacterium]
MPASIIEIDLHGKNAFQAKTAIDAALKKSYGVYRIRLIHGYNLGTVLKEMIIDTYSSDQRVLRLNAVSKGITELVLKEL